jgi:hypothetical protein
LLTGWQTEKVFESRVRRAVNRIDAAHISGDRAEIEVARKSTGRLLRAMRRHRKIQKGIIMKDKEVAKVMVLNRIADNLEKLTNIFMVKVSVMCLACWNQLTRV